MSAQATGQFAVVVSSVGDPRVVRQSAHRTALAGLIGNTLEWFDFAVYGYFATDIGRQFFPPANAGAQQLLAFAVFAVGFTARPIGSLVLGVVGDRVGRRALLTFSIALMGAATLAIGLLPTYAQVGIVAPVLLVLFRLAQGFSVGAEFTGSMVYTTEMAARRQRGLVASSSIAGGSIGFILGSGSAWLTHVLVGPDQPIGWRWRIPFIASVLLCGLGWLLRRGLQETAEGEKAARSRPPLVASLVADWRPLLQTFGIVAMTNAAYYLTVTFVVERRSHEPGGSSFLLANTLTLFVILFAKVFGGWLSDRIGRRRLMLALTFATMALMYPTFAVMMHGSLAQFALAQALLAIPVGMGLGLHGAMVVEIFPLRTRVTSMSFAYSLALALAGGTAPLVSTWLIDRLGQPLAPAFYIVGLGVVGIALMWPMAETNMRPLDA
jgi:MHS family proline/betaine transporter-like MFS transporter